MESLTEWMTVIRIHRGIAKASRWLNADTIRSKVSTQTRMAIYTMRVHTQILIKAPAQKPSSVPPSVTSVVTCARLLLWTASLLYVIPYTMSRTSPSARVQVGGRRENGSADADDFPPTYPCIPWTCRGSPGCSSGCRRSGHTDGNGGAGGM